jgi:hypothetical protein
MGLLEITWRRLEEEHQLEDKFAVTPGPLLAQLGEHLGIPAALVGTVS